MKYIVINHVHRISEDAHESIVVCSTIKDVEKCFEIAFDDGCNDIDEVMQETLVYEIGNQMNVTYIPHKFVVKKKKK